VLPTPHPHTRPSLPVPNPRRATAWRGCGVVLVLTLLLALAGPVVAQASLPQPVDPLKRPEPTPGRLALNLSLSYAPTGGLVLDYDADGNPYSDTYAVHAFTPNLALSYALTDRLTLGGGFSLPYRIEQTLRRYSASDMRYLERGGARFSSPRFPGLPPEPGEPLRPLVLVHALQALGRGRFAFRQPAARPRGAFFFALLFPQLHAALRQ